MPSAHCKVSDILSLALHLAKSNKLASLEATLVRNYDSLTHSLTEVRFRATSVANKNMNNGKIDDKIRYGMTSSDKIR